MFLVEIRVMAFDASTTRKEPAKEADEALKGTEVPFPEGEEREVVPIWGARLSDCAEEGLDCDERDPDEAADTTAVREADPTIGKPEAAEVSGD